MPVKNILVALDGTPPSDTALSAAVAMQRAYDAHLTGYVSLAEAMVPDPGQNWVPAAIRKSLNTAADAAAAAIEQGFLDATAGLPPERTTLIRGPRASDSSVAEAARFFDVTLVGLPDAGHRSVGLHPDRIALLSGRPVLAFPQGGDVSRVAQHAMIAWDGSRAAARALHSAMRLLETKARVTIVTVGGPRGTLQTADGLDPETSLLRHGLHAHWITVPSKPGGIAATLLAQAKTLQAELLVMGAFEHSKFREDLFGGVTHDVMKRTRIPVFLAH